jgi:hypothetical protein
VEIKESQRNRKSAKLTELVKPSEMKVYLFLIGIAYYNVGSASPLAIVPLPPSFNSGPSVLPKPLLTFMTGISLVSFISHQVTTMLSASESIFTDDFYVHLIIHAVAVSR